jgi:hypothetical protein
MSVNGDGEPRPSREQQIRARIGEIHEELGALLRELRGEGGEEDSPEKKRAAFRLLKGGLILVLIAASLGMANAAGWTARHARTVAGAAVGAGAAGMIAGALLAHGSPVPHPHAGVPPTRPTAAVSASPSHSGSSPSPSAHPRPERTRGLPPTVPVLMPPRSRRPSPAASGTGTGPVGPSPTPSRPGPSPTSGSPPPPPVFSCPAGLVLQVLGIGVYVCV